MDNYHSDKLTIYKYQEAPTLLDLINFLSNIKPNQINIWLQEIEKDNLYDKYITTDNHYKLITHYLNYDLLSNNKNFKYRNIAIFEYFN